jgi:membrane-bound lytic murein transglycosylase MltF
MPVVEIVVTCVVAGAGLLAAYWTLRAARLAGEKSKVPEVTTPTVPKQTVLERVMETKTLRVGCIAADPWFFFEDGKAPAGIYAALFDDFAKRNGLTIEYQTVRNNHTIQLLNEGKIDVVASLLHTVERAKRADFAAFIHNVALLAVARKRQNKIKVLGDLKLPHVRCVVVKGEIGAEVADTYYDMTEVNDRAVSLDTKDVPSIFYQVAQNLVDVAITTGARWVEFKKRDPETAAKLAPAILRSGSTRKRGFRARNPRSRITS